MAEDLTVQLLLVYHLLGSLGALLAIALVWYSTGFAIRRWNLVSEHFALTWRNRLALPFASSKFAIALVTFVLSKRFLLSESKIYRKLGWHV